MVFLKYKPESIFGPRSHLEFLNGKSNISTKFGSNWASGLWEMVWNVKS